MCIPTDLFRKKVYSGGYFQTEGNTRETSFDGSSLAGNINHSIIIYAVVDIVFVGLLSTAATFILTSFYVYLTLIYTKSFSFSILINVVFFSKMKNITFIFNNSIVGTQESFKTKSRWTTYIICLLLQVNPE